MNFPPIKPPVYPLQETYTDHSIKMQMDNLTINTRPRFTKMPKKFKLTWTALPAADFAKLRSFYLYDTKGGALSFAWTYPNEPGSGYAGKSFMVRFEGDLDFSLDNPGYYSGSVTLAEV